MSANEAPYRIGLLPPPGQSIKTATSRSSAAAPIFRDALTIRMDVFVTEQGCSAEEEVDIDDAISWHWVLFARGEGGKEEEGVPAATIRFVPASTHDHGHDVVYGAKPVVDEGAKGAKMPTEPNYGKSNSLWDGKERYAKIGRLATREQFRGRGFGKLLLQEALKWAGKHHQEVGKEGKWNGLVLAHAQVAVEGWYEGLGWARDEGMGQWWEEGIEHVAMWRRVNLLRE